MDRRDGAARIADTSVAERFSDAAFSASAIDRLRADVERLRGNLSAAASPEVIRDVDRAMGVLSRKVQETRSEARRVEDAGTALGEALGARLDGLRDSLDGLRASEPTVALAAAVDAMARKLDLINAKAVDPVTIARLQLQTAELKDLVDRTLAHAAATAEAAREEAARQLADLGVGALEAVTAASADFNRMAADALSRIETRLEQHLADRGAPESAREDDLAALRDRLDQLSRDVRALGPGTDGLLAARMTQLLDRIDQGGGIEAATLAPLVDVLERHLVTLTERMGASHARLSRLDGIETLLERMTSEMQRMQRDAALDGEAADQRDVADAGTAVAVAGPALAAFAAEAEAVAADGARAEAVFSDAFQLDDVEMAALARELIQQMRADDGEAGGSAADALAADVWATDALATDVWATDHAELEDAVSEAAPAGIASEHHAPAFLPSVTDPVLVPADDVFSDDAQADIEALFAAALAQQHAGSGPARDGAPPMLLNAVATRPDGDAPLGARAAGPFAEALIPEALHASAAGGLSVLPPPAPQVHETPQARPAHEAMAVWQVPHDPLPHVALDRVALDAVALDARSRDRLSAAPKRRPGGAPPVSGDRQPGRKPRPRPPLNTGHGPSLDAAVSEPNGLDEAPRVRLDWVAAADRADHREKGASPVRRRRPARWTRTAVRFGAVAAAIAVLTLVTVKLTVRDGGSLGLQALVAAPAAAIGGGTAPVDKALLSALPPPVGPAALKTAALAGDADAACEVGMRYADGKGTDVDTGAAMKWLGFAAAHGSVPAAYRLGSMYEYGSRNVTEARKLYQWAAERGNLRAMHNLGVLYSDGLDGKPDWSNAITWFRRAAELGLRDSQYNLGVIYGRGLGGAVDRAEAWKWFSLAANQGDTDSARKRDDVANKAEGGVVDRAKAAVAAFVPGAVNEAANTVPVKPEWEVAGPGDVAPRKSASRS